MHKKYISALLVVVAFFFLVREANATRPMISSIANQHIKMNTSTPVLKFNVSDNEDTPGSLVLTYESQNKVLVPDSDDNIILGGSGSGRTVQVIPENGKIGNATIIITVTDSKGDQGTELFNVEVNN